MIMFVIIAICSVIVFAFFTDPDAREQKRAKRAMRKAEKKAAKQEVG